MTLVNGTIDWKEGHSPFSLSLSLATLFVNDVVFSSTMYGDVNGGSPGDSNNVKSSDAW